MEIPNSIIITEAKIGQSESAPYVYEKRYKGVKVGDILVCVGSVGENIFGLTVCKEYGVEATFSIHDFKLGIGDIPYEITISDDRGISLNFEIGSIISNLFCLKSIYWKQLRLEKLEKIKGCEKEGLHSTKY